MLEVSFVICGMSIRSGLAGQVRPIPIYIFTDLQFNKIGTTIISSSVQVRYPCKYVKYTLQTSMCHQMIFDNFLQRAKILSENNCEAALCETKF